MGFKGNRIWLIGGLIGIFIIAVIIVAANQSPSISKTTAGQVTVTIDGEVGTVTVKITNLNTGTSINRTAVDLPFRFNCTKGDTIQVTASTVNDYAFNSWFFNNLGTFDHHNPLLIKVNGNLYMTALCQIYIVTTPTPTETPTLEP